jgi:hypothetical protein
MRANETATTRYAVGQLASDDVAGAVPVLPAVWCRSVGTSWTLELYELSRGTPPMTLVDWLSSGVPISQPGARGAGRGVGPSLLVVVGCGWW